MKMYIKGNKRSKEIANSIPNAIAFTVIRKFLTSREFEESRNDYCIGDLNKHQVNQIMSDIKWLFKNYKDLEILSIDDNKNKSIRFIL